MDPSRPAGVDARELRAAQGIVAVALLAGFVFGLAVLVAAVALAAAAGAIGGPQANPLHAGFRSLVGPRLDTGAGREPDAAVRALDLAALVLCGVATLAFLVGISGVGWALALAEAGVAAIAASTGVNAAALLQERLRRR